MRMMIKKCHYPSKYVSLCFSILNCQYFTVIYTHTIIFFLFVFMSTIFIRRYSVPLLSINSLFRRLFSLHVKGCLLSGASISAHDSFCVKRRPVFGLLNKFGPSNAIQCMVLFRGTDKSNLLSRS